MPPAPKWKPWHEVVQLRDELKSGELSLAMFAADLDEVILKKGKRPIYEDPKKFFALTYPTYNLRNLARDVVRRLAGKSDKAVRQLNLTYGGGKTHTLITLFHLVDDPANLPDLPAVEEFRTSIDLGKHLPKARVAAISSLPSGEPCTSCVPALLGEPLPMTVLQQISVGLAFCALAAAMARSTASTSWPSTLRMTFQP